MIDVRMAGGLGNQLFQFAMAAALGAGTRHELRLRTAALSDYRVPRRFLLARLLDLPSAGGRVEIGLGVVHQLRLARIMSFTNNYLSMISDRNAADFQRATLSRTIFLDGYFAETMPQIAFEAALPFLRSAIIEGFAEDGDKRCVVHIRGTDFRELGFCGPDQTQYLRWAVGWMESHFGALEYVVLTDDPSHAREVCGELGIAAQVTSGDPIRDFFALMRAPHRILSRSTFSFWAAALSPEGAAVATIAPTEWRPGVTRQIRLPDEINPPQLP